MQQIKHLFIIREAFIIVLIILFLIPFAEYACYVQVYVFMPHLQYVCFTAHLECSLPRFKVELGPVVGCSMILCIFSYLGNRKFTRVFAEGSIDFLVLRDL